MNRMFLQNTAPRVGTKVYESRLKPSGSEEIFPASVFTDRLVIGNQCMHFTFGIKFFVKDTLLQFTYGQLETKFTLVNNDGQQWLNTLRRLLNQKGFHEKYRSIKKIGKGNFASVYMVEELTSGNNYAVKAFSKEAAYGEDNGKECLIKEIQIMRHLEHPNVMKLYEIYETENSLYLVFELLEEGQLFDILKSRNRKFSLEQVRHMTQCILKGLQQLHSKNIMHRDLKPENILIRSNDSLDLVIADFGLAEFSNSQEYLFVRCGTPGYVAPEVINIRDMKVKYSPVCDIFSLGLIFHIFLFNRSVFKGKNYNEILAENRACNFVLEGPGYDQTSIEALDLLRKMLRVDPDERITAEEALAHPFFRDPNIKATMSLEIVSQEIIPEQDNILTSESNQRKKTKLKKDSCLDFKMADSNIMTGRRETFAQMASSGLSGLALSFQGKVASKFKRSSKQNYN